MSLDGGKEEIKYRSVYVKINGEMRREFYYLNDRPSGRGFQDLDDSGVSDIRVIKPYDLMAR